MSLANSTQREGRRAHWANCQPETPGSRSGPWLILKLPENYSSSVWSGAEWVRWSGTGRLSMMCCFTLSTCGVWSQDMKPCVPLWHVFQVPEGARRENYDYRKHSTPVIVQLCIISMSRPCWWDNTLSLSRKTTSCKEYFVVYISIICFIFNHSTHIHTSKLRFKIQTCFSTDT